MPEYTEEQKAARQKAVRNYEKNNYRLNIVFPKGTKERIEKLGLDKTNSAFIRDTVLAKLDELEKMMCKRIRAGFCPALILTLKYSIRVTPTSF